MGNLVRFGLQWNEPKQFVCTEMPDGYWTPWHVAQDRITALESALRACVDHMTYAGSPDGLVAQVNGRRILEGKKPRKPEAIIREARR